MKLVALMGVLLLAGIGVLFPEPSQDKSLVVKLANEVSMEFVRIAPGMDYYGLRPVREAIR
jgi:hypothetical protein